MSELITVVGNAPFPDIPYGRAVTVERTRRIDGLLASRRITRVDTGGAADVPRLIEDIQVWVGTDPDRARVALDVESARTPDARSTLVAYLEDLIAPPSDDSDRSAPFVPSGTDHTGDEAQDDTDDLGALD